MICIFFIAFRIAINRVPPTNDASEIVVQCKRMLLLVDDDDDHDHENILTSLRRLLRRNSYEILYAPPWLNAYSWISR